MKIPFRRRSPDKYTVEESRPVNGREIWGKKEKEEQRAKSPVGPVTPELRQVTRPEGKTIETRRCARPFQRRGNAAAGFMPCDLQAKCDGKTPETGSTPWAEFLLSSWQTRSKL